MQYQSYPVGKIHRVVSSCFAVRSRLARLAYRCLGRLHMCHRHTVHAGRSHSLGRDCSHTLGQWLVQVAHHRNALIVRRRSTLRRRCLVLVGYRLHRRPQPARHQVRRDHHCPGYLCCCSLWGHCYGRQSIARWVMKGHRTCCYQSRRAAGCGRRKALWMPFGWMRLLLPTLCSRCCDLPSFAHHRHQNRSRGVWDRHWGCSCSPRPPSVAVPPLPSLTSVPAKTRCQSQRGERLQQRG